MAETTARDADANVENKQVFKKLKDHVNMHKLDFMLWVLRFLTILFTIGYFIPIFWNPYTLYFKALASNVGISALRLSQRLTSVSLDRQFFYKLLLEDTFHYMIYSAIFYPMAPVTLVLQPIFLFSVLHSASYSLTLLDILGQNACWGARLLISFIEYQSRNILRLVSFTEIFLFPFTIILIFLGRANVLTPFFYYQFLCLRYSSRRNPYTRNMFHELRLVLESTANKPGIPKVIRQILFLIVSVACRLGPSTVLRQE